ncbi:hypothetical protein FG05_03010 [Fusarium graminearum]|nr:hypothetical protein FG05_03010 [Fusarium graminearum]
MTPRRSLRIANKLAAAGSNQAYADPPRLGKRKTRDSNDDESPRAKKKAPIKKAKSKKVQDQTKTPDLVNDEQQPVPPAPKDALASLPTEIQIQILSNVYDCWSNWTSSEAQATCDEEVGGGVEEFEQPRGVGYNRTIALRKLHLGRLEVGQVKFFKSLEKSFCSAERRDIQLRELTLDMHPELQGRDAYEMEMDAMYRFIASFGTLTSLEIYDHNRFPHCRRNNPGLSEQLQEAIIVHSGLESLRLRYSETGEEVPFFSTPDIETFTKNLSELRVLEVMVRDNDIVGLVKAFSYTKDLESLTCGSPGTRDRRVDMGAIPFCEELMIAFLDLAKDNNEFVWEKTYRLKQLSVDHLHVEVGSDLKRHLTMLRTFNSDDRSVCIREKFGYLGPPLWEGSSEWASQIMKSV